MPEKPRVPGFWSASGTKHAVLKKRQERVPASLLGEIQLHACLVCRRVHMPEVPRIPCLSASAATRALCLRAFTRRRSVVVSSRDRDCDDHRGGRTSVQASQSC